MTFRSDAALMISTDRLLQAFANVRQTAPDSWSACCPAHADRAPSLSIRALSDGRTLVHCFAGCDPEAVLASAGLTWSDVLGERPTDRPLPYTWRRHAEVSSNDGATLELEKRKARCERTLAECVSLDDPLGAPVMEYLVARLHPAIVDRIDRGSLLCHPSLEHYDPQTGHAGAWPCMVAKVQGPRGQLLGLHRTWVSDGRKAPVSTPRLSLSAGSTMVGGCVRLMGASATVAVGEGIETSLAFAHLRGIPAWSALSAAMLKRVELPQRIRRVHVIVDLDRSGTGQAAADALARRMARSRRASLEWPTAVTRYATGLARPAESIDWADLIEQG